jgi:hypothetical protein
MGVNKLSDDSSSLTFELSQMKRRVTRISFPHQPLLKTRFMRKVNVIGNH